jgi:predicted nucleic acid-binding protein
MLVVSNNSPLRYFVLLDCVHLLPALFARVTIPMEVQAELQRYRTPAVVRAWIVHPPVWLDMRQVSGILETDLLPLDGGEQEARTVKKSEHIFLPAVMRLLCAALWLACHHAIIHTPSRLRTGWLRVACS